jgi:rhodanese-related sulfurtransferase
MFNFFYRLNNKFKSKNYSNRYYRCYYTITDKNKLYTFLNDVNNFILDVRTHQEYKIMHVKNAINIPIDILENNIDKIINDKDSKILIYCMSGNKTKKALEILNKMGYINIYIYLNGGIIPFKELNLLTNK